MVGNCQGFCALKEKQALKQNLPTSQDKIVEQIVQIVWSSISSIPIV